MIDDDVRLLDDGCPKCGEPLLIRDCEYCGGDGIRDDLFEEDPCWYSPGEWEWCRHCAGNGAFIWCGNEHCDATADDIRRHLEELEAIEKLRGGK